MNKLRYESPQGDFLQRGTNDETSVYWADRYTGEWGRAVFGHHPFIQQTPRLFPHAVGLDTGCVYGGWLSAGVVQEGATTFVTVPAKEPYAILS
jgi:bis(5'-nucleosyl)-tetraphosphatase (symmetrical)